MVSDIRIDVSLPRHRKYRRLKRLLGESPMEYLVIFWVAVAEQNPTGALNGWSTDDIEDAAEWRGEPGLFADSLIDCGFLDILEDGFRPHNWEEIYIQPLWMTKGKRPNHKIWRKLRLFVFERDNYICQYCGKHIDIPDCDHVFPLCRGGSNDLKNLVTACPTCNRKKSSKLVGDFI